MRYLFKDVLLDSPNIALINLDLTIIFILPPFPGRGISRLALHAVAETLQISRANAAKVTADVFFNSLAKSKLYTGCANVLIIPLR